MKKNEMKKMLRKTTAIILGIMMMVGQFSVLADDDINEGAQEVVVQQAESHSEAKSESKPSAEKPASKPAEKPAEVKEQPAAEKPAEVKEQPAAEKPAEAKEQPAAEKPAEAKEQPAAEKPADVKEQPAAEKPADVKEQPADEKPADVKEQPADEKPVEVKDQSSEIESSDKVTEAEQDSAVNTSEATEANEDTAVEQPVSTEETADDTIVSEDSEESVEEVADEAENEEEITEPVEEVVVEAETEITEAPVAANEALTAKDENPDNQEEVRRAIKAQKIKEFLDALAVTSNFVIYADTFNENCHIDGNIAVNNLTTDSDTDSYIWNPETGQTEKITVNNIVETLKRGGSQGENPNLTGIDNYSIIYNAENRDGEPGLVYGTVDGGAVIVAADMKANNLNGGSKLIDVTAELEAIDKDPDKTDEEKDLARFELVANAVVQANNLKGEDAEAVKKRVKAEADITGNLSYIAEKAKSLNEYLLGYDSSDLKIDDISREADTDKDGYVSGILQNAADNGITITMNLTPDEINNIPSDDTDEINNIPSDDTDKSNDITEITEKLGKLMQLNKDIKATIILNIDTSKAGSMIEFINPINGNNDYDASGGYIFWNFGDYAGTIKNDMTTEGIIVAPNATADVVVMDGRVVANTAYQNPGQEIHQPNRSKEPIVPRTTVTPTPKPTPTPTNTPEPTPTNTPEPTPTPTNTPEVTPTPAPHKTPKTPEHPTNTPEVPTTPVPTTTPGDDIIIDDEDVPMSSGVETGDHRIELIFALAGASLVMLAAALIIRGKRKHY